VPGATAEDSPIEAAQNRMFCKAGPVKRHRAAREVVDAVRDRGARKPDQQSAIGSLGKKRPYPNEKHIV
jgi:hypothetical protein